MADLQVVDQFEVGPTSLLDHRTAASWTCPRREFDPVRNPWLLLLRSVSPSLLDPPESAAGADVDPLPLVVEVAAFVNEIVVGAGEIDPGPLPVIRHGIRRLGPRDAGRRPAAGPPVR